MARFRFKIVDSQGRRRSGVLRADSLEVAESALRSKLCQIEELTPVADDGHAVDVGRLESSFSQIDKIRRGLAAVMLLVFGISVYSLVTRPDRAAVAISEEAVSFKVSGELALGASQGEPSDWKVFVVFPDVPYEVGGRLKDGSRTFTYQVDLLGTRPEKAAVDVEHENRRWRLPESVRMPASGDLDLGLLTVAQAPAVKKYVSKTHASPDSAAKDGKKKPGRRLTRDDWKKAMDR